MADRYWVGGNADWDATAGTKWSLTSGGSGGEAVPTASDAVFLDNGTGTGNVTWGSGYTPACLSLDCTGYVGTLATGTQQCNVSGSATLAAGMTITGTGTLNVQATGTVTPNGKAWPGTFRIGGTSPVVTVAAAWTVGTCLPAVAGTLTLNGLLTATTMTLPNAAFTFNGTAGWTCTTLNNTTPTGARTTNLTYGVGIVYECTTNLNLAGVNDTSIYIKIQASGTHPIFNFTGAAPANLSYVRASNINSSGGQTIYTTGTIVTSENWSYPGSMWLA